MHVGQEEVCRWCVVSEVAGYGLACCMELRDFMLMALEKQCLFLSGVCVNGKKHCFASNWEESMKRTKGP